MCGEDSTRYRHLDEGEHGPGLLVTGLCLLWWSWLGVQCHLYHIMLH